MKQPPLLHSAKEKGFFDLLVVNFLNQFLGFGTTLLVAKFLTPVELGEVRILQSYTAVFAVFAVFGINTAVLKNCSEGRDAQDRERILRAAMARSLITTGIALLVLIGLSAGGIITSSRHLSTWLIVYALAIPFATTTNVLIAFLQALKRIRQMARAQAWIKAQSFVAIVLGTWLWGFPGLVFSTIAARIAGLIPLLRQVGSRFLAAGAGTLPADFAHIAIFSVLANGVGMVGRYSDIFILDHFSADRAAIGCYSLATIFTFAASQVTGTVQSIATPYFSERADDPAWFRSRLVRNQIRVMMLSIATAFAVYGLAWILMSTVYAGTYRLTLSYLPILLLRYVVWSSYSVIGVALLGLGYVRYNSAVVAVAAPLGLALSYVLLTRAGIVGVAWAQVFTALGTLPAMLWMCRLAMRRKFGPA